VIIRDDGIVKVPDFGLAKFIKSDRINDYAALGDDRAIDWLERDLARGNTVFLAYVTNFYVLERLHNNER
jgi:hypothetical protein